MIPSLTVSGILPPFLPSSDVTSKAGMAPYKTSITELADKFDYNPERKLILKGLLDYRECLRNQGIINGFQWIDGSYVEDCENIRARSPNDVDIVTFAQRPTSITDDIKWQDFVKNKWATLFDRDSVKAQYKCDAYYVDLNLPPINIVSNSRYWFGLFSHQRVTYLWKGLLEIPLQSDDADLKKMWGA